MIASRHGAPPLAKAPDRHQLLMNAAASLVLLAVCARGAVWLFGFSRSWLTVLALVLIAYAALYCAWARNGYQAWADAKPPTALLIPRILPALVGVVMIWGGGLLLRASSLADGRWRASFSVVLLVGGLIPVADIIHTRARTGSTAANVGVVAPLRWYQALPLNALAIVLSLIPLVTFLGVPAVVVGGVAVLWLVNVALGRFVPSWRAWLPVAAVAVIVSGVTLLRFLPSTWKWGALGAVGSVIVGMRFVSIWVSAKLDVDATRPWFLAFPIPDNRRVALVPKLPSDDRPAAVSDRPRGTVWIALLVALVPGAIITAVWLRADLAGASLATVILVAVGLLGFGAVFITRGEGFALVAVLALVTIWAVANRDSAPPSWQPAASSTRIVVLGDSYSSGEGGSHFLTGTNVEGANNCRRSPVAYGFLVAEYFQQRLTTFACSGAVADQISSVGQVAPMIPKAKPAPSEPAETVTVRQTDGSGEITGRRPQLDDISDATARSDTGLVILSIGGNDALFGKIGKACALPGTCKEISDSIGANLAYVQERVTGALVTIAQKFPHATVALVAYPAVLGSETKEPAADTQTAACSNDVHDQPANAPLDTSELCLLRTFLSNLDRTLAQGAAAANERLTADGASNRIEWIAETEHAFELTPEAIAAAGSPLPAPMNMIHLVPPDGTDIYHRVFPGNWIHDSFHPTDEGQRRIACVIERHLNAMPTRPFAAQPEQANCIGVGSSGGATTNAETTTAPASAAATPSTAPKVDSATSPTSTPTDAASVSTSSPASATAGATTPGQRDYGHDVDRLGTKAAIVAVRDVVWLEGAVLILLGWLAAVIARYGRATEPASAPPKAGTP